MHSFPLDRDHIYQLYLCADSRHAQVDILDDQIWEITLASGEPPAMTLQTTYGLRCHWMRLFPRFTVKNTTLVDPFQFSKPPVLEKLFPDWVLIRFEPFEGISVLAEYRAVDSHVIAGRFKVSNQSILPQSLKLEWVALLNPLGSGESMLALQKGGIAYLQGKTGKLAPTCVMSGTASANPAPYPSLSQNMDLYPGGQSLITWSLASLDSPEESLYRALSTLDCHWEAETARIEMTGISQNVEIETGNPDWDAAIKFSQNYAWSLLLNGSAPHSNPTLVLSRHPDLGYSPRETSRDLNPIWSSQTAVDAWYMSQILLPGAPATVKELLNNFFTVQNENGWIDWKIGLSGQISNQLSIPILATLTLQLFPYLLDYEWLKSAYLKLVKFIQHWFSPMLDRDQDYYPEWQNALQSGLEDSPIYNRWSPTAQGLDIKLLESPSLGAFLVQELDSLLEISRLLGQVEGSEWLHDTKRRLLSAVQECWKEQRAFYGYRDAVNHQRFESQTIGRWTSSGSFHESAKFLQPLRLVAHLSSADEMTLVARVTIRGTQLTEEIEEKILPTQFAWSHGHASAFTQALFTTIHEIEINGLREGDSITLSTAGYDQEDCSLFLPLWAGIPIDTQAKKMVEQAYLTRFRQPMGLPICQAQSIPADPRSLDCISLPWNLFLAEGLFRYGYCQQSAELVSSWLQAVSNNLRENHTFRQYYHALDGSPFGEKAHLHGLIPVNFFLTLAGIQQLTPNLIVFSGNNNFLRPIHVKYKQVDIQCHTNEFVVKYSAGPKLTLPSPGPHRVSIT
jgi:hypothetical protein